MAADDEMISGEMVLRGRRAFVAGAGQGIGLEAARTLARMGAAVFLAARDLSRLTRARDGLAGEGHGQFAGDLARTDACEELARKLKEWGPPHIVVANLHVRRPPAAVQGTRAEDLARAVGENLEYLTRIMPAALREQKRSGFGRWIAVGSAAASLGGPGQALYSAQKSALEALMRTLAVEQGRRGITANTVSPGFVETPGTLENYDDERRAALARMNLMQRAGRPEEIAHAIAFLASPLSGFITGINLPVSGGYELAWPLADMVAGAKDKRADDKKEAAHV